MVTWGSSTIKTFTPSTPAAATGFTFGGTSLSPAGVSATPTSTGTPSGSSSLFAGSTPGPPQLFPSSSTTGTSTASGPGGSSNSTVGFGSTAATGVSTTTTPSSVLFGGGSTSNLFGTPSSSANPFATSTNALSTPGSFFPAQQQQQQQQQQQFASANAAAYQHHQIQQRQEVARIEKKLYELYSGYSTVDTMHDTLHSLTAPQSSSLCRFQAILYDPISTSFATTNTTAATSTIGGMTLPQQHLLQHLQRPLHVESHVWAEALAHAPPGTTPVSIVGAEALQARVVNQQTKAETLQRYIDRLFDAISTIRQSVHNSQSRLHHCTMQQRMIQQRLLRAMQKVELLRCMNIPIQTGELEWKVKLDTVTNLLRQVEQITATEVQPMAELYLSVSFTVLSFFTLFLIFV